MFIAAEMRIVMIAMQILVRTFHSAECFQEMARRAAEYYTKPNIVHDVGVHLHRSPSISIIWFAHI
jgi:hypothetical protein